MKHPHQRHLLEQAAARGIAYKEAIDFRRVSPDPATMQSLLQQLDTSLGDDGEDDADILALLDEVGSPLTVAMSGPRFFGFVIGGALPVTVATNWLTTAWDQNVALHDVTAGCATIERVALDWMVDILGLPTGTGGGFVTGATVANFTALAAARHRVLEDAGWNVEADGLIGAPPVTVIVGEEAHPTLNKSLGLLGFGRESAVRVPVDGQGRMLAGELPELTGPTIICTQAGNINSGAFDPIAEICERATGSNAWVHVDGAFGLWAAASGAQRDLIAGFEKANSWATDAHKWLNVPYDSGIAFVASPNDLAAAMAITAEYLPPSVEQRNPADYTPELSRRARGVDVWAALKSLGRNGVGELVARCCRHARRFADGLSDAGYDIANDVVLNQVLVSFGDAVKTKKVIAAIQEEGTCWCGGTLWQGQTLMRISVSSWATTDADVEESLAAMLRIAATF